MTHEFNYEPMSSHATLEEAADYFEQKGWKSSVFEDLGIHEVMLVKFRYEDEYGNLIQSIIEEEAGQAQYKSLPNGFKVFKNIYQTPKFHRESKSVTVIVELEGLEPEEKEEKLNELRSLGIEITEQEVTLKKDGEFQTVKVKTYQSSIKTNEVVYDDPFEMTLVNTSFGLMAFSKTKQGLLTTGEPEVSHKFVADPESLA